MRESRGEDGLRTERRIKQLIFIVLRVESVGLGGRGEAPLPPDEGKPLIIKFLLNSPIISTVIHSISYDGVLLDCSGMLGSRTIDSNISIIDKNAIYFIATRRI
jgi:hypothetical protein